MKSKTTIALFINLMLMLPIFGNVEPRLSYHIVRPEYAGVPPEYVEDFPFIFAKFRAEGFPENIPLDFTMTWLNEQTHTSKVIVDQNHHIIHFQNHNIIPLLDHEEVYRCFGTAAKGEPFKFTLSTTKGKKISASVEIIPYPLTVKDEAGHTLSLKMIDPFGENYRFEAAGFEPNESLRLCSKSGSEIVQGSFQASDEGKACGTLLPAVIGASTGSAAVQIIGITTKNLRIEYKWGSSAFQSSKDGKSRKPALKTSLSQ